MSRHCELAPHGEGTHGSRGSRCTGSTGGARKSWTVRILLGVYFVKFLTGNLIATRKRVTSETIQTGADWTVVAHTTLGLLATYTWAGIDALAIHTSLVGSAL